MRRKWVNVGAATLFSASSLMLSLATTAHAAPNTTISWLIRSDPIEVKWAKQVVTAFQKANPNISVNLMVVPQSEIDQKLQTMFASGSPPDIVMPDWAVSGFGTYKPELLDLTPYLKKDPGVLNGWIPKLVKYYNVNGQQLGIPILNLGSFLYYNKDLFKAANIPFPTTNWNDHTWTWDKMVQDAKKLTKISSNPNNTVFGVNDSIWPAPAEAWLWGGDYFNPSAYITGAIGTPILNKSKGVVLGIQHHADLIQKYKVAPSPNQTIGMQALGDPFLSGRIGMELNGGWFWGFAPAKFHWGVAAIPWTTADRKDALYTDPISISKGSKNPDAAWKLVKFIVNPKGALKWFAWETQAAPPQTELLNEWIPFEAKNLGLSPDSFKQVIDGANQYGRESADHLIIGYSSIDNTLSQSLNEVYNGRMSLPTALKEMQENLLALHLK